MTPTHEAIHAAAKTMAGFNNEAWLFEPPLMDGVTRSAEQSAESYLREAQTVLEAATAADRHARILGNPVSGTK